MRNPFNDPKIYYDEDEDPKEEVRELAKAYQKAHPNKTEKDLQVNSKISAGKSIVQKQVQTGSGDFVQTICPLGKAYQKGEFCLSDKIKVGYFMDRKQIETNHFIITEDVKEFIRLLKEEIQSKHSILKYEDIDYVVDKINKFAGEKLL